VTVGQAMALAEQRLSAAGVPTPRVDAELLLRHATGWSRTRLIFDADAALPPDAEAQLDLLVQRRENREPLQLILGTVGFRYVELEVRAGVFIPRPETEVLAGEAIARVPAGGVVLEPCTGTGAIACSVAFESAAATVIATDVSPEAVELARANGQRTSVDITVLEGDLLDPVDAALRGQVHVLVSNPPYLTPPEVAVGEPEVAQWDPPLALVSGATGHEVTDRLIADAGSWLRPGGWLLLEVDSSRAEETARRAAGAGLIQAAVLPDLTGADRIVVARCP
jgi:release factor glutamine methyltransferase